MRAESNIVPEEVCVESLGETARLRFCENVRRNEEGAELEYVYDEYTDEYSCSLSLDEDEMGDFLGMNTKGCQYYRYYDEYKSVHKQI